MMRRFGPGVTARSFGLDRTIDGIAGKDGRGAGIYSIVKGRASAVKRGFILILQMPRRATGLGGRFGLRATRGPGTAYATEDRNGGPVFMVWPCEVVTMR